mgnify:CR=1 FL=1
MDPELRKLGDRSVRPFFSRRYPVRADTGPWTPATPSLPGIGKMSAPELGCLAPSRIWLENATGRSEMMNNHCKRVLTCLVIISKTLRAI